MDQVREALRRNPIAMLVGPRQCGKTTLARQLLAGDSSTFFDMEDPAVRSALTEPMSALRDLRGTVVIDEAQREPALFPVLRVLADRPAISTRFLLLGSATPELSRQAAESLAGRVEVVEMRGFSSAETGEGTLPVLWQRGGFPRSYLAESDADSFRWRTEFINSFLERDLGTLGFGVSPKAMGRFWSMLAHYHGQIWNASEIAASMGVSPHTTRAWLDTLEQTFMVRTLQPWYENLGKRLVKSPKIYLRDSGLFHALQGVKDTAALFAHPKLGASWEGFALEETLAAFRPHQVWFYAVHSGSELDLFFLHNGMRTGVEFKREDAPRATRSMRTALADLRLDRLYVVYPGTRRYELDDRIACVPLEEVHGLAAA